MCHNGRDLDGGLVDLGLATLDDKSHWGKGLCRGFLEEVELSGLWHGIRTKVVVPEARRGTREVQQR
jgi:hypothetical protein